MMARALLLLLVAAFAAAACASEKAASRPNILLFLVDDMGYGDLGCYGRQNISTPHIDKLADQGVRFTQWISAAPICTPSRAGIMTGRLARRFGMTANQLPWRVFDTPSQPGGFPYEEITVAELLRDKAGYTTAMSGKWHLGVSNMTHKYAHLPPFHGFESWLGDPFTNMQACKQNEESNFDCIMMANHTIVQQPRRNQNLTSELVTHTVDAIRSAVARGVPFFMYHAFLHVHTALFSSPAFTNVSRGGRFGDNVEEMDWGVGQVLAELDALGIANNTLVILTSDNGPFAEEGWDNCGRTGGLTGSKGQTFEGGIRVPGIVRWPGVVPAGVVSDVLVSSLDIMPTALAVAGVPLPTDRIFDGRDITAVLRDPLNAQTPHEFMWHYCGTNVSAVRYLNYKLHFRTAIWTSDAKPTPLCVQCCPYGATALNGTGGTLCDCADSDVVQHDPPLVFDMTTDKFEKNPLTPATLANFTQIVNTVKQALQEHYATIHPLHDEMHTLPVTLLEPCCGGGIYHIAKCECDDYVPHQAYP